MSIDRFLDSLSLSCLIEERALRRAPSDLDDTAEALSDWMVRDGLLTAYQARRLLAGKWRRLLIDRYEIREFLGKGGMGTVYLSFDRPLRRSCALKVLDRAKRKLRRRDVLRFSRETLLGQRLSHPNIASSYEAGEWRGTHFLAMEYVPGPTLYRLIKSHGPVDPFWAAHWICDVANALDYAHQQGVVHRDLKPSNLIIMPSGSAKLLDLGLARWFHDDHNEHRVIGVRRMIGSFDYMAPEQASNSAQADARSDIYGMGCLLYFALVGRPPFHHVLPHREKVSHHQRVAPESISKLRPDLPIAFVRIVNRMLAKAPKDRPQVAAQVHDALREWLGRYKEEPPPLPGASIAPSGEIASTDTPIAIVEAAQDRPSSSSADAPVATPSIWTRIGFPWIDRLRGS